MLIALNAFKDHEELVMWYYGENMRLIVWFSHDDWTGESVYKTIEEVKTWEGRLNHIFIHEE